VEIRNKTIKAPADSGVEVSLLSDEIYGQITARMCGLLHM
jgi:hypothetical protein